MKLQPAAADPLSAGLSMPLHAPPGVKAISHVYALDLDTLRFLANARSLRLQTSDSDFSLSVLIPESESNRAVRMLHEKFKQSLMS